MKYLLTNGLKTSDTNTYIKDVLYLNFKLLPVQVPFNETLGVNRIILEESKTQFEDSTREMVKDLLKRLTKRHKVTLLLTSMEVTTSEVKIKININNQDTGSYSIDILN